MVVTSALSQLRGAYLKLPLVRTSQCCLHVHRVFRSTSSVHIATRPAIFQLSEYASLVHSKTAVLQSRSICLDVKLRNKANQGEDKEQQVSVQSSQSGPGLTAAQKGKVNLLPSAIYPSSH